MHVHVLLAIEVLLDVALDDEVVPEHGDVAVPADLDDLDGGDLAHDPCPLLTVHTQQVRYHAQVRAHHAFAKENCLLCHLVPVGDDLHGVLVAVPEEQVQMW